jgi:hypothetical protein
MAPRKTGLDAEIRDLYRGPLDEFTPGRNALASRLKKEKRADDAAEVKSLPKPTPSAWGVNLLFEREPEKIGELLAAGKKARTAQREAVSGRGAESLRETIRAARSLADELRWDAARILTEQGRSPSRDIVERIAANLQALAFSPSTAEEADRGWLDRDLDPPGFEVLAGLQLAGSPVVDLAARRKEQEKKKEEPEPARPKLVPPLKKADRDTREAQKEVEERRKQEAAEEARREREAERIRRRVAVAEEKVERARAEADPLREETERAEAAVADARRRLEEAERTAEKARERYERAAERLAHAEAALREAGEGE